MVIAPRGENILAVQYTRPAMAGSLHIPASYDKDGTWSWWETVTAGPDVEQVLGIAPQAGDLFRTPWRPGIPLGMQDSQRRPLFIVPARVQQPDEQGRLRMVTNVTGIVFKYWEN